MMIAQWDFRFAVLGSTVASALYKCQQINYNLFLVLLPGACIVKDRTRSASSLHAPGHWWQTGNYFFNGFNYVHIFYIANVNEPFFFNSITDFIRHVNDTLLNITIFEWSANMYWRVYLIVFIYYVLVNTTVPTMPPLHCPSGAYRSLSHKHTVVSFITELQCFLSMRKLDYLNS